MKHAIFALCAVALLAWGCGDDNPLNSATESRTIVSTTVTLAAGAYKEYAINVTADLQNASVRGNFTVTGVGTVEVAVLNEVNFNNWLSGKTVTVLYGSGQLQTDEFSGLAITDPGVYYLVLSNVTGTSQKTVSASYELRYSREK